MEEGSFDQSTVLETDHLTKERKIPWRPIKGPITPLAKLTKCAGGGTFCK